VISAATLVLVAADSESTNAVGAHIRFRANAADNAAAILNTGTSGVAFGLSSRQVTSAAMRWFNVPSFVAGTSYTTPDMSNIVQEVVSRPGWVSGNNFMLIAVTDRNGGTFHRAAVAGNMNSNLRAVLQVTFNEATTSPTLATTSPTLATTSPSLAPTPLPSVPVATPVAAPVAAPVTAPVAVPIAAPVAAPTQLRPVTAPTVGTVPPAAASSDSTIDMGTVLGSLTGGLVCVAIAGYFVTHFEVRKALLRGEADFQSDTPGPEVKLSFRAVAPNGVDAKYPPDGMVPTP
jgi:biotin carboxyl carrier protein